MALASSFICFFISLLLILVQAKGKNGSTCPKSFSCGRITDLSFPFYLSPESDCGLMPMSGCGTKPNPKIQLLPGGDWYYAFAKPFTNTVLLWDTKIETTFRQNKCQAFNKNLSLLNSSSISFTTPSLYDFFKCNSTSHNSPNNHIAGYEMYNGCKGFSIYYKLPGHIEGSNLPANCSLFRLPIESESYDGDVFKMLSAGFEVEWKLSDDCYKCHYGGGQCNTDKTNKFHCTFPNNLPGQDSKATRRKLGQTLGAGKLKDRREIAVKRLYEHNCKRMEQFVNEIDILTRLRHNNLVTLYGCTSRRSRELLLVYEYISNGTLADHLHDDRAKDGSLAWPVRMNIAIETAGALAYLHASDVIHCDVKTNNILLDHNFTVKVADFGISRLFPNDVSHISTAPRGTPGYIDPKYHECYQLTSKSDVYSFGVVLVELISSMPAVDMNRHSQEINLANFAINKIVRCAFNELIDPSLGLESDTKIWEMTTSVAELAFLCLQSDRDTRPTMVEVLDTLKEIQTSEFGNEKRTESNLNANEAKLVEASPNSVTDKWITCSDITSTSS